MVSSSPTKNTKDWDYAFTMYFQRTHTLFFELPVHVFQTHGGQFPCQNQFNLIISINSKKEDIYIIPKDRMRIDMLINLSFPLFAGV